MLIVKCFVIICLIFSLVSLVHPFLIPRSSNTDGLSHALAGGYVWRLYSNGQDFFCLLQCTQSRQYKMTRATALAVCWLQNAECSDFPTRVEACHRLSAKRHSVGDCPEVFPPLWLPHSRFSFSDIPSISQQKNSLFDNLRKDLIFFVSKKLSFLLNFWIVESSGCCNMCCH